MVGEVGAAHHELRYSRIELHGSNDFKSSLRDVILDSKYVVHQSIVGFRPYLITVFDLDELHGDPNAVAGRANAALENRCHIQRPADLGDGGLFPLE